MECNNVGTMHWAKWHVGGCTPSGTVFAATLFFGHKVICFGGRDNNNRYYNDLKYGNSSFHTTNHCYYSTHLSHLWMQLYLC
jgi:hypothetical protein